MDFREDQLVKTSTNRPGRSTILTPESPTHNVSRVDHALASLRESSLTLAIMSHVSALAIVASKSFASRRLRLSHAMVRSTTQRRGNSLKPLAASDRLTISIVQQPIEASAFLSF